jgi:tetratricopeptide (TPR) repeat protein
LRLLCGLLGAVGAAAQELSSTPREVFREGYAWHTGEGRTPDLTKALRFYRQAIKADPDLFEAFSNAGLIYIALEDYKNAEYYLGQAIRLAREREDIDVGAEAKVSSDMGSCYYKWGDYREAEKWFRGAIRIDPGLSEARYNLINLMLKEERREEVQDALSVAARLAPSDRYGIFEGRLKGRESWIDNPLWVKLLAGLLLVAFVLYVAYAAAKARATP